VAEKPGRGQDEASLNEEARDEPAKKIMLEILQIGLRSNFFAKAWSRPSVMGRAVDYASRSSRRRSIYSSLVSTRSIAPRLTCKVPVQQSNGGF
jgi:hypothetical protein